MIFDATSCWIAAASAIVLLLAMGIRNRQTGYRRERTDTPAEIAMMWAGAMASDRQLSGPVIARSVAPEQISADLAALGVSLGRSESVVSMPQANSTSKPASPEVFVTRNDSSR